MSIKLSEIKKASSEALIKASTSFRPDQINAYKQAIKKETQKNAKWLLETILENALIAEKKKIPLCDDTGVPYVLFEVGDSSKVNGNISNILKTIKSGIADGLRSLSGRPMAVKGNDLERVSQSKGLYKDPGMITLAPIRIKEIKGNQIRLTVLMLGGGPEIRSRTCKVFHHHDSSIVNKKISDWAVEMIGMLGCTPCVPAIGIGRTHYEATCLAMDAMTYGVFGKENRFEKSITSAINKSFTGTLGVGGKISALQSFVRIGPQRASGVRIVSLRLGCCFDPRRSTIILESK